MAEHIEPSLRFGEELGSRFHGFAFETFLEENGLLKWQVDGKTFDHMRLSVEGGLEEPPASLRGRDVASVEELGHLVDGKFKAGPVGSFVSIFVEILTALILVQISTLTWQSQISDKVGE